MKEDLEKKIRSFAYFFVFYNVLHMPTGRDTKLLYNKLEILTTQIEKKKLELQKFEVARELLMDSDDETSATETVERPQFTNQPAFASAPTVALEEMPMDYKPDQKSPPPIPTPLMQTPNDVGNMSLRHFIK